MTSIKNSVFDVKDVNYVGVPSGLLYSNKKLEDITVYDLTNEKIEDFDTANFLFCYKVSASDSSVSVENNYIGYFYNGQYYEKDTSITS
jgi:hypothetical protein